MRILIVADWFFPSVPNGLARVAWDVARLMTRRGHHVEFIAAESSDVLAKSVEGLREGVVVHRFPRPRYPAWNPLRGRFQIRLFRDAIERVLPRGFDVIHFHSIFTGMATLGAIAGMSSRPALAYTVHSPVVAEQKLAWPREGMAGVMNTTFGLPAVRWMESRLLACADVTHALSRFTVAELLEEHVRIRSPLFVIPHWIGEDWRRSRPRADAARMLGWDPRKPILLSCRAFRERYGLIDAVEAIAPCAKRGCCSFKIVGSGPLEGALRGAIREFGVEDSIEVIGRLSDEQLRLAYEAADLFVLPTRALECFGLIMLEALGIGVPVLGTRVGAIPEVLEALLPSLLVEPGDVAAMRAKVENFLDGRLDLPSSPWLSDIAHRLYGESSVARQYDALYTQALQRR